MSKIEKLCDAYERFGQAIATVPDDKSKELSAMSAGVREFVSEAPKKRTQILRRRRSLRAWSKGGARHRNLFCVFLTIGGPWFPKHGTTRH